MGTAVSCLGWLSLPGRRPAWLDHSRRRQSVGSNGSRHDPEAALTAQEPLENRSPLGVALCARGDLDASTRAEEPHPPATTHRNTRSAIKNRHNPYSLGAGFPGAQSVCRPNDRGWHPDRPPAGPCRRVPCLSPCGAIGRHASALGGNQPLEPQRQFIGKGREVAVAQARHMQTSGFGIADRP